MNCPQCGTENPQGFRFCGNCGQKLAEQPNTGAQTPGSKTIFFGAMQTPNRARLVLIKGEGLDGVIYHLAGNEHYAGRVEGDISFPDDPLLSPKHACFYYSEGKLCVRDENSVNGIYCRVTTPALLNPGARFLIGEQLLHYEPIDVEVAEFETDRAGTHFYGSPKRPGHFRIKQILRGGDLGMIFRAPTENVVIGREGNDINFPDDPFISGQHAKLEASEQGCRLVDLGSKNGTFVRVDGTQTLSHGDYLFLGQQLFRVEIT